MIYLRTRLFGSTRMTNAANDDDHMLKMIMTLRCNEVGNEALKSAVIAGAKQAKKQLG